MIDDQNPSRGLAVHGIANDLLLTDCPESQPLGKAATHETVSIRSDDGQTSSPLDENS